MKAELQILHGQHSGLTVPLDHSLIVGSDPDCDLQLFDGGVSGRHFRITVEAHDITVETIGKSETFLNNAELMRELPLYHQDLIRAGQTTLQFLCSEAIHPGRSSVDLFAETSENLEAASPISLEAYVVEDEPESDAMMELGELCRQIASQETAQAVIETLIERIDRLIPFKRIVFVRFDTADGKLIATRHRRAPGDKPGGQWRVHRSLIERCCKTGKPVSLRPERRDAALVAPLEGRHGVMGALYLEVAPGEGLARQLRLLSAVTGQAGLVLERCQLLSRIHHQGMREQSKMRALLESLQDGVALLDDNGKPLVTNPLGQSYLMQLGLLAESGRVEGLAGRPLSEFGGEPRQLELGERTYRISLARTEEGWRGYGLTIRDVTEERQARMRLMQAEKLSSLGQTVSGVAHELNNPLTGVLGFAEMLMGTAGLDDEVVRQVGIIHREAERCRRIVKNLLTFARRQGPELSMVDVDTLLDEVLELKEYDLRVTNVELVRERADELPSTCAVGHQLKQVFVNLVHNAHQAVSEQEPGGRIRVATRVVGAQIEVEVSDNGPGIEEEVLSRIFDPFFTTKEVGHGVGLGLSLSYGIVSEHGGEISVTSPPGEGAHFVVRLPIRAELPPELEPPPLKRTASGRLIAPRTVLVVDDEEVVRELIGQTLQKMGCSYEFARSGREALRLATEQRYDCMICDLKMPGMSGEDLYQALERRGNDLIRRTLFISGDLVNEKSHGFLSESGCPYVLKPFSLSQLETALGDLPGFGSPG